MYFDIPDLLISVPFFSMTTLLLRTRYFPSGTKRRMEHDDNSTAASRTRMIWSLLPFTWHGFSAKVRIISLHYFCHREIATAYEDYISEMGIVDGGTVGMIDGFKHFSTQAHVEGLLG